MHLMYGAKRAFFHGCLSRGCFLLQVPCRSGRTISHESQSAYVVDRQPEKREPMQPFAWLTLRTKDTRSLVKPDVPSLRHLRPGPYPP